MPRLEKSWSCDHAAHGYSRGGNFGGLVFRAVCSECGCKTHSTAKLSEEVNRKCPARNTTVQLSIPTYTDPERHNSQRYRLTDGQKDDSIIHAKG